MMDLRKADEFNCNVAIDGYKCRLVLNNETITMTYDQLATISREIQVKLTHERLMRKKEEMKNV